MVRLAKEFSQNLPRCRFVLNEGERLDGLRDSHFGFIYSSIVLQHIAQAPSRKYIAEFVRVLKPGGALVFQIPDTLLVSPLKRLRAKLDLRAKVQFLFGADKPYNMEMHCIPEADIRKLIHKSGARVVDVRLTNSTEPSFCGNLQYIKLEPLTGYVSKQYCVVKEA
jgi:ubiquinone/menaquinone biosynthesis C-methylase UbiE